MSVQIVSTFNNGKSHGQGQLNFFFFFAVAVMDVFMQL